MLFVVADGTVSFESALTIFDDVTIGGNAVLINGIHGELRVGFDPDLIEPRLEEHAVEFEYGVVLVHRMIFALREMVREGMVRLEMVPI